MSVDRLWKGIRLCLGKPLPSMGVVDPSPGLLMVRATTRYKVLTGVLSVILTLT